MKKSDTRKLNRILSFIQISDNIDFNTTIKNLIEIFGGKFFNTGGNNYLYGIILNPHIWIYISSDSYIVYETMEKIESCQWHKIIELPQYGKMTEYYL